MPNRESVPASPSPVTDGANVYVTTSGNALLTFARNGATGQAYMWLMNGATVSSFADVTPAADPAWRHINLP